MSVLREIAVFLCGFIVMKASNAQVVIPGPCPDIQAMSNFDLARYMGKWYEAEAYFTIFEFGGKCITAEYDLTENGTISVVNKQISRFTGAQSEIRGEATKYSGSVDAKFTVRFSVQPIPMVIPVPYWVVGTDYDTYSVVWSCVDLGVVQFKNSWLLTREQNPPQEVMDKALGTALRNGIVRDYYISTNQKDCP